VKNWYNQCQSLPITQEADVKKWLFWIALIAIIDSTVVFPLANKMGLKIQEIRQKMDTPDGQWAMEKAQEVIRNKDSDQVAAQVWEQATNEAAQLKTETPQSIDLPGINDIISVMLEHENVIPGQTPARITHPNMRSWKTYQGFPTMTDDSKKPRDRRNFIFLKNPGDVPAAVKKQLSRYVSMPSRFGLPNNPTLGEAMLVFDQQNPRPKMEYMKSKLLTVDFSRPLADYLNR